MKDKVVFKFNKPVMVYVKPLKKRFKIIGKLELDGEPFYELNNYDY